jgi:hypothetical protein
MICDAEGIVVPEGEGEVAVLVSVTKTPVEMPTLPAASYALITSVCPVADAPVVFQVKPQGEAFEVARSVLSI